MKTAEEWRVGSDLSHAGAHGGLAAGDFWEEMEEIIQEIQSDALEAAAMLCIKQRERCPDNGRCHSHDAGAIRFMKPKTGK